MSGAMRSGAERCGAEQAALGLGTGSASVEPHETSRFLRALFGGLHDVAGCDCRQDPRAEEARAEHSREVVAVSAWGHNLLLEYQQRPDGPRGDGESARGRIAGEREREKARAKGIEREWVRSGAEGGRLEEWVHRAEMREAIGESRRRERAPRKFDWRAGWLVCSKARTRCREGRSFRFSRAQAPAGSPDIRSSSKMPCELSCGGAGRR